jgi:two-component system, OmpR family, alkaline phosphatase synthesis response regulator PhoP
VTDLPGTGLCALVIDDEDSVRNLVRTTLELDGWRVLEAPDGDTGLEVAEAEAPNGIVLDVMMPGKDGFAVLTELRQRPIGRTAAVVMLTARAQPSDIYRGTRLGADLYLTKPFEPEELSERLLFHTLRRDPAARAEA